MTDEERLAARRPYTAAIGMDALVVRKDGSSINFGDAIYHPENAEEARAYAAEARPPDGLREIIYAVVFSNYFPRETDSLWEREEDAEAHAEALFRQDATQKDPFRHDRVRHRVRQAPGVMSTPPAQGTRPTDREIAVLLTVARLRCPEDAAHHLGISEWTVRSHLRSIRARFGVETTLQALYIAHERGLFPEDAA